MANLTDTWTAFTRAVFLWIVSPQLIVPTLLAASALTLVPRLPLWGKYVGRLAAVLLAIYLVLATPLAAFVLTRGLTLALPTYAGEPSDAVVVLSRGDELGDNRYDLAIQLWQRGQVPKIFVTSMGRIGYMTNRFKQESIPLSALSGTTCARTTYEEAASSAALLQPKQAERIALITDAAHMWRSVLTFRHLGFTAQSLIAPYPADFSNLDRSVLALREYLGLIHYAILGRLAKQSDSVSAEATDLDLSNCTVKWLSSL